jgi:MOSC domain-containing protein YiiM
MPWDKRWRTAFVKEPVRGPVWLGTTNLAGDGQADPRVHGGPDMAVLCYSGDHYPRWRDEIGMDFPNGGFGENFTVAGRDERSVCIGDVYEVGETVVQVSQPRGPCSKIANRWQRADLLDLVLETGRHGWYLRVLRDGHVEAGQELRMRERPHPEWTVRRAADVYLERKQRPSEAAALATCPALAGRARNDLERAARRPAQIVPNLVLHAGLARDTVEVGGAGRRHRGG